MEAQIYIEALGKALQQNIQLDEDGTLIISIDEVPLLMQWRSVDNVFQLQMSIGALPYKGATALYPKLLAANFLAMQTAGAFISYNEEVHHAFLEGVIPVHSATDPQEFVESVERFVHNVDAWTTRFADMRAEVMAQADEALEQDTSLDEPETINPALFLRV